MLDVAKKRRDQLVFRFRRDFYLRNGERIFPEEMDSLVRNMVNRLYPEVTEDNCRWYTDEVIA